MKTSQVKFDWEIVNKEETHNRSDNSDESRKRKFGAENADDSSQNHEKNIEYSYLFGCDFTVENLNEAKSWDLDHNGESTNSAHQIGHLNEQNGPVW